MLADRVQSLLHGQVLPERRKIFARKRQHRFVQMFGSLLHLAPECNSRAGREESPTFYSQGFRQETRLVLAPPSPSVLTTF
jgi:hypothetical protein